MYVYSMGHKTSFPTNNIKKQRHTPKVDLDSNLATKLEVNNLWKNKIPKYERNLPPAQKRNQSWESTKNTTDTLKKAVQKKEEGLQTQLVVPWTWAKIQPG